jgi:hypothetical protein
MGLARFSPLAIGFLVSAWSAACGSSSPHVRTEPVAVAPTSDPCPMTVPGTSVTVEDTPTGAALVFVTTGELEALRSRVGAWAEGHNAAHAAMGPLPTGDEIGGQHHHDHGHHGGGSPADHGAHDAHGASAPGEVTSLAGMIGIHSRAAASPIEAGVRFELITFPDQIAAMRDELRAHARHLATGRCAMPAGS